MGSDDFEQAYQEAKYEAYLGTTAATTDRPRAIILAGQPGAGKTNLKDAAKEELAPVGGSVVVDPDDLRRYHRHDGIRDYEEMARRDYRSAASRVQPDASDMGDRLRSDAMAEKRNLIIDGTLKNPDSAERLCHELRREGYEVEVRALAVSETVSRRSVAERLENALAAPDKDPRDVPQEVQDQACRGMPESVARIEHGGLADRISVYRRGDPEPIYLNEGGLALPGQDAKAEILAERTREMTSVEKIDHAKKWDWIAERGKDRNAPAGEQERYAQELGAAHVQLREDPVASAGYDAPPATPEQISRSRGFYYAFKAPPEPELNDRDDSVTADKDLHVKE